MTITEFLLARITDDEAAARAAMTGDRWWVDGPATNSGKWWVYDVGAKFVSRAHADHIARHDPARVLAECEAKRRIVELHGDPIHEVIHWANPARPSGDLWCRTCGSVDDAPVEWPCPTLSALASVYADHAEFDPAWKL